MIGRLKNRMSPRWPVWFAAMWLLATPILCPAADLTLFEAVDMALEKNPRLQAAQCQILTAQEKIIQARSGGLPQVSVSEQLSHTTNPMWAFGTRLNQESITMADFDPARLNDPDGITNYASVLSVNWPVYDGGQTRYGLHQAKLSHEVALLSVDRTRQQIILGTINAYNRALLVRENQKVLVQILETTRSHLKLVQSRYSGGFVAKSDLLRAQVHMADVEQQLADAKSQSDIARCHLNVSMGVDGSLDYTLTTALSADEFLAESLDTWIGRAMSNRPDLKVLTFQKQLAEAEIDKSKASRYPSVSLSGNYEFNTDDFNDTASNYTIGAVVSVPLYTGGRTSSRIREAMVNLNQARALLRSMEQQVCGEVRQAFFSARSAWERIGVARAAIGQSEESLRIVRNRYNNGLFTIADLLDAEVMVQQSLTSHLKAIHDYRSAVAYLDLAAGTIH